MPLFISTLQNFYTGHVLSLFLQGLSKYWIQFYIIIGTWDCKIQGFENVLKLPLEWYIKRVAKGKEKYLFSSNRFVSNQYLKQ